MKKQHNKQIKPLVSVLMPVFCAEKYVKAAVESVLSQTFGDFELVIVDDGSGDESLAILKQLAKKDKRIRLYQNDFNSGIGYTRKRLASLARGTYAAIMDADDIMLPDRLEKQVKFMEQHKQVIVLGGQCITINEMGIVNGEKRFPLAHNKIYDMMFTKMSIQQPASMINLKLVPSEFPWYDNSVSPVEDLDNLFRLFNYGNFANLRSQILKYRVYCASNSLKNPKRTFWLTMKVRMRAVFEYGYKPTVLAIVAVIAQSMVVAVLPSAWVFPVYAFLRGMKNGVQKVAVSNWHWARVFVD